MAEEIKECARQINNKENVQSIHNRILVSPKKETLPSATAQMDLTYVRVFEVSLAQKDEYYITSLI